MHRDVPASSAGEAVTRTTAATPGATLALLHPCQGNKCREFSGLLPALQAETSLANNVAYVDTRNRLNTLGKLFCRTAT
jgi:hypothetical protein